MTKNATRIASHTLIDRRANTANHLPPTQGVTDLFAHAGRAQQIRGDCRRCPYHPHRQHREQPPPRPPSPSPHVSANFFTKKQMARHGVRGRVLGAMPRRNQQTMLIGIMLIVIVQYARRSCCFCVPDRECSALVLFPRSARLSSNDVLPASQLPSMHAV